MSTRRVERASLQLFLTFCVIYRLWWRQRTKKKCLNVFLCSPGSNNRSAYFSFALYMFLLHVISSCFSLRTKYEMLCFLQSQIACCVVLANFSLKTTWCTQDLASSLPPSCLSCKRDFISLTLKFWHCSFSVLHNTPTWCFARTFAQCLRLWISWNLERPCYYWWEW